MSYSFLRKCKIVLYYNNEGYLFDTLSNINLSQTFARQEYSRKTLHNKKSSRAVFSNVKNTLNYSFDILCTDTYSESVLLTLAGLDRRSDFKFEVPNNLEIAPKLFDIYIISEYNVYRLKDCCLESIDLPISAKTASSMSINISGSSMDEVYNLPSFEDANDQGNPLPLSPIQATINNTYVPSIINAGINIQQTCRWFNEKTLHEIGKISKPSRPVIEAFDFTITLNSYKRGDFKTPDEPFHADLRLEKAGIYFYLENALFNKRITPEEVFQESYDIIITDKTKTLVEYGGILI